RVLITGATGLVGSRLVRLLKGRGISVNYLTTRKGKIIKREDYCGFFYNPKKDLIDEDCLEGVGAIINLAGENIAKRWTDKNKKKILNSRLDVVSLLFKTLEQNEHHVGQFITASGISIYPHSFDKMYEEDESEVPESFLGRVLLKTEAAADQFENLGLRVAKIRTGIVLAEKGGALPKFKAPFNYHLGAALGSGKQWQSWIDIEDIARIYLFVLENGLQGNYNAVAPNPVTNQELMQEIASTMGQKIRLPNVPAFAIKLALGEMAETALSSQLVSDKKIIDAGFTFNYKNLGASLEERIK
ncbi:MAG TPA: TIGR01777 family oxidoreductase, partial [Salinimicrobium sp.]|nr:TIGR01777 family oxidoreductase [Salinimicrobium sp.]